MFNSKEGFTVMLRYLVAQGMSQSEAYFSLTSKDVEKCIETIEAKKLDLNRLLAMVDILNFIEDSGFELQKRISALSKAIEKKQA